MHSINPFINCMLLIPNTTQFLSMLRYLCALFAQELETLVG
jgi:hypothetical protein